MKFQLIDEICTQDWKKSGSPFMPETKEIAGAQVFCINNVDHFFWANFDRYRDSGGFPNYAPPFDNYFMYCDDTEMTTTDAGMKYRDLYPQFRYGFWFLAGLVEQVEDAWGIEWFTARGTNRLLLKKSGVKWRVLAIYFTSYAKGRVEANMMYQYLVNEDGTIGDLGWDSRCGAGIVEKAAKHYGMTLEEAHDALFELGMVNMASCHLATALLHCKNVTTVDAEPTAKEKYRMSEYQRVSKQPAAKWKVLSIEPMVRTLRTQGAIERNGITKALHICRGHFKDFSHGKGLFGRNKGLYWWDQQMRGNESAGVVIKDYDIQPPENSSRI
jgi:hypothetical protein